MDALSVSYASWSCKPQPLSGDALLYVPLRASLPISFFDALCFMRDDEHFRRFLISLLAACSFRAYRWETPPVNAATVSRRFEFVLISDPALEREPDPQVFASYFQNAPANATVTSFLNLGKDAYLIVPRPLLAEAQHSIYVHLASFVRHAPPQQVHELWRVVGTEMPHLLGDAPRWLSTAGLGVSWLHVRIDQRPKYYRHVPYYTFPTQQSDANKYRGGKSEKKYSK